MLGETLRPKALIRGDDGYVVGSILRVKLYNFLTYEGPVEFFPGPYLNLILGPNGTGKSSIACAIAIGLGWPPKARILGRADNLNQFVKTGADNGWTEIELKGRLRERNPIIRREINVKNRASNWLLNGKQVPMKDINAKVKSLNIQIENLCSFMPQDKVSEFAKMTPQQLLIQTQRAAGDEHLTEWHTELIELGAELAKHLTEMEGEATQLKRLEDKNRELEREVARWREKQLIEQEVALWEIIVPVVEYTDLKNQYLIHKEKVGEAARKFQELQDRNDPMNELQERIAAKVKELESQRKRETDRSTKKFNDLQRKQAECEDTTSESLFTELGELKKEEKERKAKIVRLKKHIADLEEKVAKPPEVENLEDIEEEATKLRDEQRTLRDEQDIFMQKINEHVEVTGRLKAGLAHHERELADLDNVAKRRLDALRRVDADCAATIEWLRKPENRHRFKMEVTEPAIVSLDVPDLRYVDQVEACISFQQAKTFVCACEEDYKLLGRLVNDTDEALGRRGRITVWFRPKDESRLNGPSLSEEQLREFGFDGYATDFVNAPEGLMWYLKKELNMHRTAVARTPNVRVKETIDKISAGPGGNFIAGNLLYRVSRSAYGKNLAQTSTSNIGSARNFKFDAVDPATKQNIEAQIASKTEELQRQEAGNEQITREQKALGEKVAACNKRQDEVKRRKDRRKKILQEHEGLKLKITMEEQRLKTEEDRPGIETKVAKIKKQIADVGEKRGKLVMQVTSLAQELLHMQQAATLTNLKLAQVKSNQVALERL
ncbi:Structural maintenance of chromosomes protein 5, partial [Tulasnella sp. 403]